jgi:hypothetical protein
MGMGYQGFVKFYASGPASSPVVLLATGASVNLVLEPIYSSAVWGAGWYNAGTTTHYADSAVRYEGSVDFEMQGSATVWDLIGNWGINERAYPRSVDISPDGGRVYQYRTTGAYGASYDRNGAWCTSLGFSTSEGSFLTCSAGMVALDRDEYDPTGVAHDYASYNYISTKEGVIGGDPTTFAAMNPLNPSGDNVDPIPFWRTNANLLRGAYTDPFTGGSAPQVGLETIEWSVDLSNNTLWLYTCNGDRLPTACLQGAIDATGSCTLYHEDGVFDPILGPTGTEGVLTAPYLYGENTWFRVTINNGTNNVYLELPAVVVESDDFGLKGQSDVTSRGFSLKGLAGRIESTNTYVLPPLLMSDNAGAFVAP